MEPRATGKSIELFFVDGRPEGILTAEVSWNSAETFFENILMVLPAPRIDSLLGSTRHGNLQGSEKTYQQGEAKRLAGADITLPRPTP